MEVLALIPARGGSKGVPRKNVRRLAGRPLIAYTFDVARRARRLTRVVLTTDSPEIAALGRAAGIDVPFLRPVRFARDTSPASDYIRHALGWLKAHEGYRPHAVVLLQPTSPFRRPADIDTCVGLLARSGADAVMTVSRAPQKFHASWQLVLGRHGLLSPAMGGRIRPLPRRQDLPATWLRNGLVYAFRTSTFQRTGTIYGARVLGVPTPEMRSVNIDDARDWQKASTVAAKLRKRRP
jgi:CMP-N,N'-diacetyllegionaminic acid synthase